MKILKTILNIILPNYCISCNKRGLDLCFSCLIKGNPNEKETEDWIYTIYDYKDPIIKKSVWALKYKNKKGIAKIFAEILYPKILEELVDLKTFKNFNNIVLIPIPLSKKRERERGYNQTMLIALELIKIDKNINFTLGKNILFKNKETKHQALIKNRRERIRNLIGSFTVKNVDLIENKNIILLDDVVTTGATLKEAKKELKKAKAKNIIAFTFAH